MEYQKIIKLLDYTLNQLPKFKRQNLGRNKLLITKMMKIIKSNLKLQC